MLNVYGVLSPVTFVAFHTQLVGEFEDVSVNVTLNGAVPVKGSASKLATGAAPVTFTQVTPDILDPPAFVAVKLTDQFPATNSCVTFRLLPPNDTPVVSVRLFRCHTHDVDTLVDVSLNIISNGAIPAQP